MTYYPRLYFKMNKNESNLKEPDETVTKVPYGLYLVGERK